MLGRSGNLSVLIPRKFLDTRVMHTDTAVVMTNSSARRWLLSHPVGLYKH